ncbi:MAG: signal peptidase I [Oscillospiraceae bacterium]|nr:signal peptidase I [Oscillospiraceae bacterium]
MPEKEEQTEKKKYSSLYDFADILVSAITVITLLFLFCFRFAGVIGSSMFPTLRDRDSLLISATAGTAKPGDIVIITQPNIWHEPLVKRVIAIGGQTIDIRDGNVFIDGQELTEAYLPEGLNTEPAPAYSASVDMPYTVPAGYVFCMGDNRNNSTDSRFEEVGPIREDYLLGRVVLRLFPFGNFRVV